MSEHRCELYISTNRGRHTALVYAVCSCGWKSDEFSKVPLADRAIVDHLRTESPQNSHTEHPLQP